MSTNQPSDSDRIRNVVAQYCRYVDDGRTDALVPLFTDDAAVELGNLTVRGREGIQGLYGSPQALQVFGLHTAANLIIEMSAATATVSADFFWINLQHAAPKVEAVGRYHFDLELRQRAWLITSLKAEFRSALSAMSNGAPESWST